MSRSQWRRELTAFLRSQQEEIVRQWADAILEIPGIRAIRTVTREEYETGMHEFLPLLLAHLENPEDLRLHEYLRQFAEKCYRVQLPEADVNRAQWFLKRILIRLLVGEFTAERSKLAYLCDLVEEEIDENRLLVSQFYHLLAQERLRESEQLTRALLNNTEEYLRTLVADSADGIIILDPEGCIQSWSRGAEAIFGYPAEEAIGRPMSFLVPEEIQARGELDWLAKEVEREGCVRHYLAERVAKDGRRLTVDLTCTALRDEEGRIRAYSLIVRDLTERRRLEQETQAQASRLQTIQELTRAISASLDREAVFAAIVAEIRRIIPFDRLSLALLEPDGQHLRFWVLADEQALASPSHDALLRKGETTLGRVVEEQKPLHISDLAEHEPLLPVDVTVLGQGVRSVLSVPLVGPQGVLGTVNLCARKPNLYHQAHLNLLTDISAPIAIAVQNVRAFEEVRKRALQFEIIHAVSTSAIDKYEDIDTLLRDVADNVHNHFQYYDVAILEIDETRGELLLKAHAGVHRQFQEAEYRQSLDQGILGYVARTGETYLANNVAEDPYYFDPLAGALPIQSELAVPIKIGERVWGVLDVQSPRLNGFDEWDKVALEALCAQLSRVLEVAENVRQVRMWQVLNENVIDLIPTALVVLDRDLRICRANERFCRRFNRQPTEVVGIPLQEVFPSTLLEAIRLEQALAEMKPGEYREWEEVPYTDGQGTERIAELRVRRLDVHDLRYVLVLHDVTERTKQLYQLQMLHQIGQAMQRTLDLDRLLHAILTCVTAGPGFGFNRAVVLLVNEQEKVLEERLRVGPRTVEEAWQIWAEIGHKDLSDYLAAYYPSSSEAPDGEETPRLRVPLEEYPTLYRFQRSPQVVRRGQADLDPLIATLVSCSEAEEVVIVPLVAQERLLGVILADNMFTRQPITDELVQMLSTFAAQAGMAVANAKAYQELQEAYQHLKETRDRLLRAERLAAIGQVAANVAHEIRNPLVSIGGFARLILDEPTNLEATQMKARIIAREVMRLERILKNVMDFTAPGQPEFRRSQLNAVIKETVTLLRPEAEEKKVTIQCDLDPNLPPTWLDPEQMQQVVLNLGRNAIQAMRRSGGELHFLTRPGEDQLILQVRDTGPGIRIRNPEEIFSPFYTTRGGGAGLGLAVTRKIVEDHGGEISVETAVGQGTTFTVTLPLHRKAPEPVDLVESKSV